MSTAAKTFILVTLLVGVHLKGVSIELTKQTKVGADGKFLSMASTETTDLSNTSNMSYYGNIGFGKDSTTGDINWAPVVFDTGSSWLWISATGCQCSGVGSGVYVDMADTDFKSSNQDITIGYGKGGGKGELGTMTVYLSEDVSYDQQAVLAMSETSGFNGAFTSGIFGLSHKAGADNNPTLLDNLFTAGVIDQKLFTVSLRNENEQSLITFGEVSETNVDAGSSFTYSDLNLTSSDQFYYTFLIDEVKLGSVTASNHYAIADTGTSLLCIPPTIADSFFADSAFASCQSEDGLHICSCDNMSSYPSMEFTISGVTYEVTADQYMIQSQGSCIIGVETITPPGELIVLGDIFLRTVVGVFDLENETIGFAHATGSTVVVDTDDA